MFLSETKSMPGTQQTLDKCLLIDLLCGNHLVEKVKDSTRLRKILEALAFGLVPVSPLVKYEQV